MPRKTTAETLRKLATGNLKQDAVVQKILLAINDHEFTMERQPVYEDLYTLNEEFYGDYNGIGVTARYAKKPFGISGRYCLIIETDSDQFELKGTVAHKAWRLSEKQENEREKTDIPENVLDELTEKLGL
jgi:hypothetical protein